MNRQRARLAAFLTAVALAAGGCLVTAGPGSAAALPVSQCTTTSGVVLAVDFGHWGGPLVRACGSTPTTGYQLLNQGGWHTVGTTHDGPAFICRIGYSGFRGGTAYPTSSEEACVRTPPASAYWSYWHADAGQDHWSYSQLGAMSYHPKPGSVDLWLYGGTNLTGGSGSGVPTISPASVRATNPTAPATGPTTHAGSTRTSAPTASPGSGPPAPASSDPLSPSGLAGGSADPTLVDANPSATASVPPQAAGAWRALGSTSAALFALVIVVLLGATGVVIALRRPREDG